MDRRSTCNSIKHQGIVIWLLYIKTLNPSDGFIHTTFYLTPVGNARSFRAPVVWDRLRFCGPGSISVTDRDAHRRAICAAIRRDGGCQDLTKLVTATPIRNPCLALGRRRWRVMACHSRSQHMTEETSSSLAWMRMTTSRALDNTPPPPPQLRE